MVALTSLVCMHCSFNSCTNLRAEWQISRGGVQVITVV